MTLGDECKQSRLKLGWSIEETAKRLSMDIGSYAAIEENVLEPVDATLRKVKAIMGIDLPERSAWDEYMDIILISMVRENDMTTKANTELFQNELRHWLNKYESELRLIPAKG